MGERMRALDWSRTAVGPMETWPQSLRTIVNVMLTSRYAMWMGWGPQLTFFYNDAYQPTLGNKQSWALGAPAREVWAEIWPEIGPRAEAVLRTGVATWDERLRLFLERSGYTEETYHTFSYSPVPEEDGGIGGMLCVVTEDTERTLGARRLAVLRELASALASRHTEGEVLAALGQTLEDHPHDLPFALVYGFDADGASASLTAAIGVAAGSGVAPLRIDLADPCAPWPARLLAERAAPVVVGELADRFGGFEALPTGPWDKPPRQAALVRIAQQGQDRAAGFLVAGVNPHRPFDAAYAGFVDLLAGQLASGLADARAREEEGRRVEALAALDRAKTAFFSNVSHELRTPLTLILGPLTDALASPGRALRGEGLAAAHRNAHRLLKLVNTLLDFSRIEARGARACREATDVAALTAELALAFRPAMERAGLAFTVDCRPLSGPVHVDREMWERIVLNLLSNALKFTFEGSIRVTLAERAGQLELVVRDTGVGIPDEELPRLFERFHRVHGARARTHEGTGIGLALVHELVRLHGGSIAAASRAGEGTAFTVTVPLDGGGGGPPQTPLGVTTTPPVAAPTVASWRPASSGAALPYVEEALRWLPADGDAGGEVAATDPDQRVLIADDNADMRDYLGRVLGERWTVEAAADGEEALAAARRRRPDLIVTDVMMPRLDGFGLLHALRALPAHDELRSVPVLMLSARAGEESRASGLAAGADDDQVKPFSSRELLARVGTHLQLAALRRAAERERQDAAAERDRLLRSEQEARREAEAANRAKDEFLAMLGHELRNPLAPIVTALYLMRLRHAGLAEKERGVIERQVQHLTRLVDDLLDVSRVTGGKVTLQKQRVELSEIVAKAVEIASPLLEQRRHHLTLDVPPRGLALVGDVTRLGQVVSNLLTNAAKYTPNEGHIAVEAVRHGNDIVLRVRDDGIGIEPEVLPRVFDLFVQEGQALDRSQGGLGLGLAIVRSLVALHGGTVTAHSDGRGRGSELTVRLPAAPPGQAPESARPGPALLPGTTLPAERREILIVDDNIDAANLLAESLSALGHRTRVAHDGPAALRLAGELAPDVAVLDIGLPVMDGYELARRLREVPGAGGVHLIAVTGYGQSEDRRRSAEAGFDAHLVKPVHTERLAVLLGEMRGRAAR